MAASRLVIHGVSIELVKRSASAGNAGTAKRSGYQSNGACYAPGAILPRMDNHGYCGHLAIGPCGRCDHWFAYPDSNGEFPSEPTSATSNVAERKRGTNFPTFALVWVLFVIARLFWN
jgi:hypothetical protein